MANPEYQPNEGQKPPKPLKSFKYEEPVSAFKKMEESVAETTLFDIDNVPIEDDVPIPGQEIKAQAVLVTMSVGQSIAFPNEWLPLFGQAAVNLKPQGMSFKTAPDTRENWIRCWRVK